jgi:transposase
LAAASPRGGGGSLLSVAAQLIEQLELAIEDLEKTQGAAEAQVEIAAPDIARAKRPRRPHRPSPDNLPVERIVEPATTASIRL